MSGALTITSTDSLSETILPRHLRAFQRTHPNMSVKLKSTNARLNLGEMDADVTIRPAQKLPAELVGRRVGTMTFRVGGGSGQSTYVALCTADGNEVQFARGINDQVMQKATWDLSPYVGKKMFIKVVDGSTSGWGHITVDDFQFDGKVLTASPEVPSKKPR